ncbi:MaoC/PaaZ C-terminal domain-containing protein [Alicycliphilus denitrificans]|uniref:MaoC/PaaZ C-terminal domain-containing protein n=1 Tax=Alicycliphilus denitrificans TaxID=179636 RepID=UPI00384F28E1
MTPRYFEDFTVGEHFTSSGRTVTEADLTLFNMISGDWNPIHADAEFAAGTRFGQRIVHGAFGVALLTGFMHQMGIFDGTAVAMLSLKEWVFKAPILIGQTLRLQLTVTELHPGSSPRVGRLDRHLQLVDQHGQVVQEGSSDLLILKRLPAQPA